MADSGASQLELKLAGRWKSTDVAEGYVEQSSKTKENAANLLLGQSQQQPVTQRVELVIQSQQQVVQQQPNPYPIQQPNPYPPMQQPNPYPPQQNYNHLYARHPVYHGPYNIQRNCPVYDFNTGMWFYQ
jgi:hypothetical protein